MLSVFKKIKNKISEWVDAADHVLQITDYTTYDYNDVLTDSADNRCAIVYSENTDQLQEQLKQHIRAILELLDYDMSNPHLTKTPDRVAKVYIDTLAYAYHKNRILKSNIENPQQALLEHILEACNSTTFPYEDTYEQVQVDSLAELWLVQYPIRVYSYCSHHVLPVFGDVLVAYKPTDKIIGLSKLARIAKYVAKQLIVQEEYTKELATILHLLLNSPVFVQTEFRHMCMEMRGVQETNSITVVSYGIDVYDNDIDKIMKLAKKQSV